MWQNPYFPARKKNKILKLLSKSNILFFKVLKKNYLVSFNMGNSELYINLILDKVRGLEVPRTTFCGYQICGPIGFIKGVVTLHKTAGFYSEHAKTFTLIAYCIHFCSWKALASHSICKTCFLSTCPLYCIFSKRQNHDIWLILDKKRPKMPAKGVTKFLLFFL